MPRIHSIARTLGIFLATVVALALLSCAIVYPLWRFSIDDRDGFALVAIGGALACLGIFFTFRLFRSIKEARADEFYIKLVRTFLFLGFFSLQALEALSFALVMLAENAPEPIQSIPYFVFGLVFAIATVVPLLVLRRKKLIGSGAFTCFSSVGSLHACYWFAGFFWNHKPLYALVIPLGIAGALLVTVYGRQIFRKKTGYHGDTA